MKTNQDKPISIVILCVSIILLGWWIISISISSMGLKSLIDISLNDLVVWVNSNMDLIIILYVFLCLQLAGLSEFKQGQDYLVVALISLIFTPLGLLFIKSDNNDQSD